jgi:glycosyltransferase involved in cell wall biosynthesis
MPSTADPGAWPKVSVIVPARDSAGTIGETLTAIASQDYPGEFEVVVAVGPSVDGTADLVAGFAGEDPRIRRVDNQVGSTPAGLNRAIAASDGEVVARVDAHAVIPPGYLCRAVELLAETGADNVGGIQDAVGSTPFEAAVAAAMRSPLGSGGAAYRGEGPAGPVDTVYLGVFRRSALERVGGFDETLLRNQDYELNIRLRDTGGTVWFSPELRVRYRPRGDVRALARQYFQYGRWKREVLRRHPGSLRLRQLAAPVALVGVVLGLSAGPRSGGRSLAVPAVYGAAVVAGAASAPGRRDPRTALALLVMHLAWGAGFLRGAAGR